MRSYFLIANRLEFDGFQKAISSVKWAVNRDNSVTVDFSVEQNELSFCDRSRFVQDLKKILFTSLLEKLTSPYRTSGSSTLSLWGLGYGKILEPSIICREGFLKARKMYAFHLP